MYTVLLADDEISVTDSMKTSISWASLGIEEVYTAADGAQALEVFRSHRVDLLITDIKMPRMDGLALLEHVRAHYPDTHCVLLSAYGEFEYARSALRLGVENYLLKPVQMNEITETIETAIDNMDVRRENKEMLFRENILRRWLNGSISGVELGERASILDINIYQSAYCAVCITKKAKPASLSAYGEECMSEIRSRLDCSAVWDNNGRYVLIIGGQDPLAQNLSDIFEAVARRLELTDKISVVIGSVVSGSDDLPASYQQACALSNQATESDPSCVRICPASLLTSRMALPAVDYPSLSPIVQKAIDYIHQRYSEGASIKEFCANHTVTTAYIGYLFKKETHVFFNHYLNSCRIGKAIEMLTSTSYKINDIAAKTGFSNPSYFISSFKKYTGVSPQKYREQYTG